MSDTVAELDRATKRFGGTAALDGVSLAIPRGSVVALLGANGAGKTTALSLLVGLRRPDEGAARLFGDDPRRPAARERLGATPQESGFPPTLRVRELLELVAAHFRSPADRRELLRRFGLDHVADRQAGGLSGGQQRRLAVALAFVGSPELLVLDEPTTGLDVESRQATWAALREFVAAGGTILLTTHYLEEAEALATSIAVIDQGRIVARGTTAEVRARAGVGRVRFASEPVPATCPGEVTDDGGTVTIETPDPAATVRALVLGGARLERLTVEPLPLEEALRRIGTGGA